MIDTENLLETLNEKGFVSLLPYVNGKTFFSFVPKKIATLLKGMEAIGAIVIDGAIVRKAGHQPSHEEQTVISKVQSKTEECPTKKGYITNERHRIEINKIEAEKLQLEETIKQLKRENKTLMDQNQKLTKENEQQTKINPANQQPDPEDYINLTEHRRQMAEIEDERNKANQKLEEFEEFKNTAYRWKEAFDGVVKSNEPLIETIEEQKAEIEYLKGRVTELSDRVTELKAANH